MKELEDGSEARMNSDSDISSPLARSRDGSANSLADRTSIKGCVNYHRRDTPSFTPGWIFSSATIADQNYEIVSGAVDSSGHKFDSSSTTPRSASVQHKSSVQASRHQRLNSALWFGQGREQSYNDVLTAREGPFVQNNQWHPHHDQMLLTEGAPNTPACPGDSQSMNAALPKHDIDVDEPPTASWTRGDDGSFQNRLTASAPASIHCEELAIADEIASQQARSLNDRTLRAILDEIREQRADRVMHFTKSELTTDMRRSSCRSTISRRSAKEFAVAHGKFDHYRRSLDRRVLELLKHDHAQGNSAGRKRATDRESTDSEGDLKSKFTIPGKYNHPSYLRLNSLNHQPLPTSEMS
jgi:hypothetical protein